MGRNLSPQLSLYSLDTEDPPELYLHATLRYVFMVFLVMPGFGSLVSDAMAGLAPCRMALLTSGLSATSLWNEIFPVEKKNELTNVNFLKMS